eukprot:460769_1
MPGINTAIVNTKRAIAMAVSPTKSKSKNYYQTQQYSPNITPQNSNRNKNGTSKPIIMGGSVGTTERINIPSTISNHIRRSLSVHRGRTRNTKNNKKQQNIQKKQSQQAPIRSLPPNQQNNNINSTKHVQQSQSHSAFQLKLNINTSHLLHSKEAIKSGPNHNFYKKPMKPNKAAPLMAAQLHLQVNNNSNSLPLTNNDDASKLKKLQNRLPTSTKILVPTRSNDTDITETSYDEDEYHDYTVPNNNNTNKYNAVNTSTPQGTPTLKPKSHYIDPQQPPLPPLKPLPRPPSPELKASKIRDPTMALQKSKSLPQDPMDYELDFVIDDEDDDLDIIDDEEESQTNGKKRKHRRTLSLRERLGGLVQSASLRKLHFGGTDGKFTHNRSQSQKMSIPFNDMDSPITSDDDKEEDEHEDSTVAEYKHMTSDELYAQKLDLIRKYREIAYLLWLKYIKVS